jgi:hypothetical protein
VTERFVGLRGTGCGATHVHLVIDDTRASLRVHADWMGSLKVDVELETEHLVLGSHSGALLIHRARTDDKPLPLPESDGPLIVEYVRVPAQPAPLPGSATLPWSGGRWTDPYTLVLWLHPSAVCSALEPDYDEVHPKQFRPVVEAIRCLERPWKLGPA